MCLYSFNFQERSLCKIRCDDSSDISGNESALQEKQLGIDRDAD